jgi:hypothetical protein
MVVVADTGGRYSDSEVVVSSGLTVLIGGGFVPFVRLSLQYYFSMFSNRENVTKYSLPRNLWHSLFIYYISVENTQSFSFLLQD